MKTLLFASLLAGATMVTGCGSTEDTSTPAATTRAQTLNAAKSDGKELFTGVFFGAGPVGALLPDLWSADALRKAQATLAQVPASTIVSQYQATLQQAGLSTTEAEAAISQAQAPENWVTTSEPDAAQLNLLLDAISAADATFFARFATNVTSGNQVLVDQAYTEGSSLVSSVVLGSKKGGIGGSESQAWMRIYIHIYVIFLPVALVLEQDDGTSGTLAHDTLVGYLATQLSP